MRGFVGVHKIRVAQLLFRQNARQVIALNESDPASGQRVLQIPRNLLTKSGLLAGIQNREDRDLTEFRARPVAYVTDHERVPAGAGYEGKFFANFGDRRVANQFFVETDLLIIYDHGVTSVEAAQGLSARQTDILPTSENGRL